MRRRLIYVALATAVLASGVMLLIWKTDLSFFIDDWDILVGRRTNSIASFLDPHTEHTVLAPVAIYKLLLSVFGMDSALPFHVASLLMFLLATVLLFVYAQRSTDPLLALLGAVLVLFLGAGWIDILWPFQIGYTGSIAAGLGMLLALEREDRAGDALACGLLAISLAFSSMGLPFAVGAVVALATGSRRLTGRLYVVAVPLSLYLAWFIGWGHEAERSLTLDNVIHSPGYVADAVSQGFAGLFELARGDNPLLEGGLGWGRSIGVIALVLALWRLRRTGVSRGLWIPLAIGGAFWFFAAFNVNFGRAATAGRYVYPSAVFIVMIGAEVLRGVRLRTAVSVAAAIVVAAAVASGVSLMHRGYGFYRTASVQTGVNLAVLEIAAPALEPDFALTADNAGPLWLAPLEAESYLAAVDDFGSPAFTESELDAQTESARQAADRLLVPAEGLQLVDAAGTRAGGCHLVAPSEALSSGFGPGRITLEARGGRSVPGIPAGVTVAAGRFSDGLPAEIGRLQPNRPQTLTIPRDGSSRPWRLGFTGLDQRVRICEAPAA